MSKADYGFLMKRYEQFKITNFEKGRPRANTENGSKKIIDENCVSAQRKVSEVFQKIHSKNVIPGSKT